MSSEINTFGAFTQTNTVPCEGLGSVQKFQRIYSSLLALIQLSHVAIHGRIHEREGKLFNAPKRNSVDV
ncbi:hypothetical protein CONCODRAFT_10893 [Conidiobolus coronatus NRRL 28638]|uniref:Uncharacterized protein n=1 Tax=Conidiobolus coronatus (strain ATCC 28846 / CBS 209.66 / NRRL 28638) TaxID=796925 RepID=A0A137NWG4_CONC2|nr:hypothetical protein CONCODRAFT_10893 [Conidiobolus coronatus NRRL 28638]|eukprot:KXN67097.1 hypothetical protein CONCODRAFT_10893 [Conidiobolus coronatus NRRL 28638]